MLDYIDSIPLETFTLLLSAICIPILVTLVVIYMREIDKLQGIIDEMRQAERERERQAAKKQLERYGVFTMRPEYKVRMFG